MILCHLETKDLLALRSTSLLWCKIINGLCRMRVVTLDRNWARKYNGMEIFDIFQPDVFQWSSCTFDNAVQKCVALQFKFLHTFGQRIKRFEIADFSPSFDLWTTLQFMPMLERLFLATVERSSSGIFDIVPEFKLSKLKFFRVCLGRNSYFNVKLLGALLQIAGPNLELVQVDTFHLTPVTHVEEMSQILAAAPSIHLSIESYSSEPLFAIIKDKELKITKLKIPFMVTLSTWKSAFLTSLKTLQDLTMTVWSNDRDTMKLKIPCVRIPSLKDLTIILENWRRPINSATHTTTLLVAVDMNSFPHLNTVMVSTKHELTKMKGNFVSYVL